MKTPWMWATAAVVVMAPLGAWGAEAGHETLRGEGMIECSVTLYWLVRECGEGHNYSPNLTVGAQSRVKFTVTWTANSEDAEVLRVKIAGNGDCAHEPDSRENCFFMTNQGESPVTVELLGTAASHTNIAVTMWSEQICPHEQACVLHPPGPVWDGTRLVQNQVYAYEWTLE